MTNTPGNYWASDVLVSMPEPTGDQILVNFGALGMTQYGINHNLTRSDIEDYLPTFAPDTGGSIG